MDELTNKQKIILILKESIKFGRESQFVYSNMSEKHKEVLWIKKLNQTIEEKIKLFNNLDEASQTFKSIFDCAKIALRKLQNDEQYNYYSADLIMKINQLEDCFSRKLKPIGFRIVDVNDKIIKSPEDYVIENKKQNDEFEDELNGKYIKENETGKKLHSKNQKRKQIVEALTQNSFTE